MEEKKSLVVGRCCAVVEGPGSEGSEACRPLNSEQEHAEGFWLLGIPARDIPEGLGPAGD